MSIVDVYLAIVNGAHFYQQNFKELDSDFTLLSSVLLSTVSSVQYNTILGVILLVLLIVSFFVAGAEIAFFSLTSKDINHLKTKAPAWRRITHLLSNPQELHTSLVIANTFLKIAIIIIANSLIESIIEMYDSINLLGWGGFFIKVFLISLLVILFCEILPKVKAAQHSLRTAYESAAWIEAIHGIFKQPTHFILYIADGIASVLGTEKRKNINQKLQDAIDSNDFEEKEQNILTSIYKFGNITVKQVMTTRLDVNGLDKTEAFKNVLIKIQEWGYSRVPVYENSMDHIVGIIHTKDLVAHLNQPDNYNWNYLLRTPYFVHEHKLIEDLFIEFQKKRIHFAVVVDEFGGTSGIVTMEDIIEQIIGEINDEFDLDEDVNQQVSADTFILEGNTMLYDACKLMKLRPDTFDEVKGESDSIAGLILENFGEIPSANEVIQLGNFEFTILEVERNRIKKVQVKIVPNQI
ncbi:gliding motility-associated protein GldE [Gynurincola endophyticus]|uniref:gliding motility-associated protein GldE n=1 Tax=Gynurincola endophyticus TaxID=2479004 RepID=UPI001F171EF8|nr:gliding motility-associated protein GldE [Gynurincola endophyticus]